MIDKLPFRPGAGVRAPDTPPSLPPASTLRRWRRRAARGEPLLQKPGPKKSRPLPLDELRHEIEALPHGSKRSRGTGALHQRFGDAISRRELRRRVEQQRREHHRVRRNNYQSIRWHEPNIAWAIDATEYGKDARGRPLFFIVTTDLASRYSFEPLITLDPAGADIAAHVRTLMARHGKPLLLKRDNGSLFNNQHLDQLLAEAAVIPLNSPPYCPRYNGGIEKAIREFKDSLHRCLPQPPPVWDPHALTPFVHAAAHLRNCTRRRSLRGATAAQTHQAAPPLRFTPQQRHATFQWIRTRTAAILADTPSPNRPQPATAWRIAVKQWLLSQNLITIQPKKNTPMNQPCVTPF